MSPLVETLRRGEDGAAGEMIGTASCTGILPARPGQRMRARVGDAEVAVSFDV